MSIHDIRSAPSYRQTALVLDDQPLALAINSAMLRSAIPDLHIVSLTSPLDALEWMQRRRVDLIVMDYRMQEMDGTYFVSEVRNISTNRIPSIIVITAVTDRKIHEQLHAVGVAASFVKPAPWSHFSLACRNLLENCRKDIADGPESRMFA